MNVVPIVRRLRSAIAWRARAACHWFWARTVLPRLLKRAGHCEPLAVRPGHTGVLLFAPDRVLRTALGTGDALRRVAEKRRDAITRWPVLAEVLTPAALYCEAGVTYLAMPRYEPLTPDAALAHAVAMFRIVRACGEPMRADFDVASLPEIRAGLDAVAELFGVEWIRALEDAVRPLAERGLYDLGFAHGDFHSRNIMMDATGNARLIDLDCLRTRGVQQFDALYFVMEAEWSRSGKEWFEQLSWYLAEEPPPAARAALDQFGVVLTKELALAYCLDRIGQDRRNYGLQYLRRELAEAMATVEGSAHD